MMGLARDGRKESGGRGGEGGGVGGGAVLPAIFFSMAATELDRIVRRTVLRLRATLLQCQWILIEDVHVNSLPDLPR